MKISFYGAAQMVTGSCFLCETDEMSFLVDCGMFQGGKDLDDLNYKAFPFDPSQVDFLLLTHAHIDHSGRIPKLIKEGFKGEVYSTGATKELCRIMLEDSGHIQEMETEWKNKKLRRKGLEEIQPMYTVDDAIRAMKFFEAIKYEEELSLGEKIKVRFINSGHMLGSSFIEVSVFERENWFVYLFTGDLGNTNIPLLKDPARIEKVDYLIIESTYGDRKHTDKNPNEVDLLDIVKKTASKGGNVVIPSFAVGRTQEILFEINHYKENGLLGEFDSIPVYVDSPLAIRATEIFRNNCRLFSKEARKLMEKGDDPLLFHNLHFSLTSDESKAINDDENSKIIISASGMCEAGRIKHHLKHNLWKKNSSVVFVGYQAPGTLGSSIKNGAKKVRIFGEEIAVKSKIYAVEGFSSHADMDGIIEWIEGNEVIPKKIILVHGEEEAMFNLQRELSNRYRIDVLIPKLGDTINIADKAEEVKHVEVIAETKISKEEILGELYDLIQAMEDKEDLDLNKILDSIDELKKIVD
ncbi:MBL fold metallo-hydrolase [Alkalibacter sp. M17DMB]|nr:MBL fold metallo-hydrolase [Alkalibacter mobilis]MBF7097625.1 MBL fold metallo-hydrolase [Alkalibacter mobilis]